MLPQMTMLKGAIVAICCLAQAPHLLAAPSDGPINVMDYIREVGDTDHTVALNRAMDAARDNQRDDLRGKWSVSAVSFPPGRYQISDAIDISHIKKITGDNAHIEQTSPNKDIFVSDQSRHLNIDGLNFHGGRDQIAVGNHNTSAGFISIRNCYFWKANGFAIRGRYRFQGDLQSTFLMIERCWFEDCHQLLRAVSDYSMMRDCWIRARDRSDMPEAERNKAMIENMRGSVLLENVQGVPKVTSPDLRWVDNYGKLTCIRVRFGGEGAGHTAVVHKARGGYVTIRDSHMSVLGNNRRPTAVYCEQIPDKITIEGDIEFTGRHDRYVMVDPSIDPATYYELGPPPRYYPGLDPPLDPATDYVPVAEVTVPQINIPGPVPRRFQQIITAAQQRADEGINWAGKQLSEQETRAALADAVAAADQLPAAEPGVMELERGAKGHRQQTDADKFIDITPSTHEWDLGEYMDGTEIANSEFLAVAEAADDTVILYRLPGNAHSGGTHSHIEIRTIEVDLDQTPILTWRMKNNGIAGGTFTAKIVDAEAGDMTTLSKKIFGNFVFDYMAWDLREVLGRAHGQATIDIKFYVFGGRRTSIGESIYTQAGDYFVMDFLRLEAANEENVER